MGGRTGTGMSARPAVLPAVLPVRVLLAAVLLGTGCSAVTAPGRVGRPPPAVGSASTTGLLAASGNGDGDSWKDTAGREYRLGLVNTPELAECYGAQATTARKRLVAAGFRAQVYTTDRYGRSVSVVTSADGTNVNVWLARHGFADDRYLAPFREENPTLATQLDPAFAAAKAERAGLWGACPAR